MLYSKIFKENRTFLIHVVREYTDRDGCKNLIIRVEVEEDPAHYEEWRLPDIFCYKSYGFSEDEELSMKNFLLHNEAIIWDDWREAKLCQKS